MALNQDERKLSPDRVMMLGCGLVMMGMIGFYTLPGMIVEDAGGSKSVNAFYCSVMTLTTIGFGDICPGQTDFTGRIFLTFLPILGLGFFCGPLLELASSWQRQVPGGIVALASFTLALGVSMLTALEGFSYSDAAHLCVITGTTIGYGDITPHSDLGRFMLALYALLVVNVMGGLLDVVRQQLEVFCKTTTTTTTTATKPVDDDNNNNGDKTTTATAAEAEASKTESAKKSD